ncbi:unnamed protein product [Eruca vesicaria subsp. sativa]|uniref:Cationic amino acid transporter C-terminal domain-containing protein n=1 Tax=Eruca vesicaria subsp. sativa TaxID=29727 RepID=A0ABC8L225_ERUVS|nr:unnamed protein product [Eruca vesicaria subsp. sativa]
MASYAVVLLEIFPAFKGGSISLWMAKNCSEANWSRFSPNGFKAVLTGATVVFFSYVGFDAVANSAEESNNPQVCPLLYIGVCLVLTVMVPFSLLRDDAPNLAEAFSSKGMKFVSILISIGAVAGLTTTLLVGLYVQSLVLMQNKVIYGTRKGWSIALILFQSTPNSSYTSSFSNTTGYSVVAACVVALRLNDKKERESSNGWISSWHEGAICLVIIACGVAVSALAVFHYRRAYAQSLGLGFCCPGFPIVPCVCIFFNIFLFSQLHYEAWIRFVVVSVLATAVYALYGQYHADACTSIYQKAPESESDSG